MKYSFKSTGEPCLFYFLLLMLFSPGLSRAQESMNSAGGNGTGAGGNVSYSIGLVLYSTQTEAGGSEVQGVQQPFEIYVLSTRDDISRLSLSVFPNPALEALNLNLGDAAAENLHFQLWDLQGKILQEGALRGIDTRLDMRGLPAAPYTLKVLDRNNTEKQSFKIIKK